ncbi:MAG: hypothetical protein H7274_14800 [Rhodoferax sp.]|nr:hypothetical protein [Rhodoferax sp.]
MEYTEDDLNTIAGLLAPDHSSGCAGAPLLLLKYRDYAFPSQSKAVPTTWHRPGALGSRLRFIVRHFPLVKHPHAELAAAAAEAAFRFDHREHAVRTALGTD